MAIPILWDKIDKWDCFAAPTGLLAMTEGHSFRLSGIRLMCQASLGFSVMAIGVKMATATLPALEVVFFRSLFGSLMITALILKKRIPFLGKRQDRPLLWLRGLSGFIALSLHFYTISILPVGTAVILNYTGPIFVVILAALFLAEKPSSFLISMILVSFAGVYLLIGKFQVEPVHAMAVFLAILSGLFGAVAVLSIRSIQRRESPMTIIFAFTAVSTIGSLFYLPFGFKWPNGGEWISLALVAIGSFYGQIWMTVAYRQAPASLVAPFSYITPLLCFIYGLFFWGEKMTWMNLLGAALIMIGGISISLAESP